MDEVWKDVVGYEGLYFVSSYGNIMNHKHKISTWFDKDGYKRVSLCKNGQRKNMGIHRIVAMAFIENPNNENCVNHIDELKSNNHMSNLEWCDVKYNNNFNGGMYKRANTARVKRFKPVVGTAFGKEPLVLESAKHGLELGFNPSHITQCCKGNTQTHKGYCWRYLNDKS
jgi:hypothetical protein